MSTQLLSTLDLEQTYWRTFLLNSELFPGALTFIFDIRSTSIGTAVLTDLTAQIQFRKLIYFGLDAAFDFVVTSEEAGGDKPSSAAFELVLVKLGLSADQIWYIGDDGDKDIAGGKAMGMGTLQKRHRGIDAVPEADLVFDDFRALRKVLVEHRIL